MFQTREKEDVVKKFSYKLPFDWHFKTTMWLTTTTTSSMHCHKLNIHGLLIGGNCQVFDYILAISEVSAFLILHYFSTLGYVGRECLRYWSFVGIWRGNVLTIYMWEDISIEGGFVLQKLPINTRDADWNVEKDKNLLSMQPTSVYMQWL